MDLFFGVALWLADPRSNERVYRDCNRLGKSGETWENGSGFSSQGNIREFYSMSIELKSLNLITEK